jgi:hypothetical protein
MDSWHFYAGVLVKRATPPSKSPIFISTDGVKSIDRN